MKPDRQKKILDLIKKFEIETQEELAQRLHEAGHGAAQSTISRDIRELNLRKAVGSQGKAVYVSPPEDSQQRPQTAASTRLLAAMVTVSKSRSPALAVSLISAHWHPE